MTSWIPELTLSGGSDIADPAWREALLFELDRLDIHPDIENRPGGVGKEGYDVVISFRQDETHTVAQSMVEVGSALFKVVSPSRPEVLAQKISQWLVDIVDGSDVYGCVLIGGMSRRMGRPKHLIRGSDGKSWLEKTVELFSRHTQKVVVAGRGELPLPLASMERLTDIEGVSGPLAGILSAMRKYPRASWIVSACDMPLLTDNGVRWLLAQRDYRRWAVIPQQASGRSEPLFSFYDFRSRQLFEALYDKKELRITTICSSARISSPSIPEELAVSWRNCNTPDDAADVATLPGNSRESADE